MKRQILVGACAIALGVGAFPVAAQYSVEPIKRPPTMDQAQWLVEAVAINNWLVANHDSVPPEDAPAVREQLYRFVDAAVRERLTTSGTVTLAPNTSILPLLFNWAGQFGVYGTDLVVQSVGPDFDALPGPTLHPAFTLTYEAPVLSVMPKDGRWGIAVPYYFMLWEINRTVADGVTTDLVIASTLFAPNLNDEGDSQSTIMFLATDEPKMAFREGWLARLQMTGHAPVESGLSVGGERYRTELEPAGPSSRLGIDAVFWNSPDRSFAVIYSGLLGPFEANHPHYVDFLQHVGY